MNITESLLEQVKGADDERVLRAIAALRSGAMTVDVRYNGGVLTAEVTSTVILGKKKPVEKTETYCVMIAPDHSECTCKDWIHRHEQIPGLICKHQLFTLMWLQEQEAPLKEAA